MTIDGDAKVFSHRDLQLYVGNILDMLKEIASDAPHVVAFADAIRAGYSTEQAKYVARNMPHRPSVFADFQTHFH